MSDSPVRHGSPASPSPTTRARSGGAVAARPAAASQPAPDTAVGRARARRRQSARRVEWAIVSVTVCLLVAGAVWLDRDRQEPVAGYGIVPQPGAATVTTPVPLEPGMTAPNFRLQTPDGEAIELADLRGEPVVIQFWTTWCLECTSQMPDLDGIAQSGDAHALGIAVGEEADRVADAAASHGATYPVLLDSDKEVAHTYGYWDYPVIVTLDADGVIVAIHVGQVDADELKADLAG